MNNFQISTIGENCELFTGFPFQSKKFLSNGEGVIRLARGDNVKEGKFQWGEKEKRLSEMSSEYEKYELRAGDVLVSMDGSKVGKNWTSVSKNDLPCYLVQRVCCFRGSSSLLQGIIKYQICGKKFRNYIDAVKTGTSIPHISLEQIKKYPIYLPPLLDQKAIEHILGTLDKKIELNNKTNENYEDIAKALFRSWFIDFDPVKTKSEGHATKLPEEISNLFPDSFENSELGLIPNGWDVISLKDMLDTISETFPLKTKEEVIFLNTGDIESGNFLISKYSSTKQLPGQAKKSIQKGDILFSEIRPGNNRHAYVYFDSQDYVVSTKLMVLRSKYRANALFEYFLLTQKSSINYLQLLAESRSGTFPQITFSELNKINFALPKNNKLINFFTDNFLEQFFSKVQNLKKENKIIEEIRDILVPKLISGELRIPDAEKIIEEIDN